MHSEKPPMYGAPPQVVVHNAPVTLVAKEEPFSVCHLVTSAISLFCCQCFGLAALILSLMSYTDHRSKDFSRYRSRRSAALGLAIAAIILGTLVILAGVVVLALADWQNIDFALAAGGEWGDQGNTWETPDYAWDDNAWGR